MVPVWVIPVICFSQGYRSSFVRMVELLMCPPCHPIASGGVVISSVCLCWSCTFSSCFISYCTVSHRILLHAWFLDEYNQHVCCLLFSFSALLLYFRETRENVL